MSTDFSPNSRPCLNCGAGVSGSVCQICGFTQVDQDGFGADITLDRMHAFTTSQGVVSVVYPMSRGDGCDRYLVENAEGERLELVVYDDVAAHQKRQALRSRLGHMIRTPSHPATPGNQPMELFTNVGVRSLTSLIAQAVADKAENDALAMVTDWVAPLVGCVADLHDEGLFMEGASPEAFVFDSEGTCHLSASAQVSPIDEQKSTRIRAVHEGFAAPEVYGRSGGQLTPETDVYFLGTVLYSILARVVPLKDCAARVEPLPIPRLYHNDVPPMLSAVALRASAVARHYRYRTAREMADALAQAIDVVQERAAMGLRSLDVDIGQEIHIGLIKGLYSPINQDNYFMHMDELSGVGVFFVTDGVSISHFGTGDVASHCVSEAAQSLSERLRRPQSVGEVDDTLMLEQEEVTLVENPLPDESADRFQLLCQVLDDANRRIGELVSPELPASLEAPPGIMAATAVGLLLEKNRASFTFIGDSRIYLIRDGHLAQISIDHNLKTQLMRNGRPPAMARQVPGANALVQCVGEFERSPQMELLPVPMQPEYVEMMLLPGDRIVLCSDGVTDYAGFDEAEAERKILQIVESAPNCRTAAFDLMVAANRGGGGDNICCIVLAFETPETSEMSL